MNNRNLTKTRNKTGATPGVPEGKAVPVSQLAPVVSSVSLFSCHTTKANSHRLSRTCHLVLQIIFTSLCHQVRQTFTEICWIVLISLLFSDVESLGIVTSNAPKLTLRPENRDLRYMF